MKLNRFWFGFLLATSIWLIIWTFTMAQEVRGNNAIGSEVFIFALPILIVSWREWTIKKILKEQMTKK